MGNDHRNLSSFQHLDIIRNISESDCRGPKVIRYQGTDRILSAGRILQDPIESDIGLIHLGEPVISNRLI